MSASLVNDVGSIIVIGDEPRRTLPSAATDINTREARLVNDSQHVRAQGRSAGLVVIAGHVVEDDDCDNRSGDSRDNSDFRAR
jgi:hypothetical protein